MLSRRCFVITSASTGLAYVLGGLGTAEAQIIAKNTRLMVGFPAGGSLDVVARLLAEHVKDYAPSVIVDNRPGAGGRIALEALKGAEADGSVLMLSPSDQITLFPHVYQRLSYDPLRDFVPVTTVCTFSYMLAIGPMVPANVTTLAQFIDWCRANPKLATYGSPGAGTCQHFLGVTLARSAGFEFVHLPYKGGASAMQDLIGGQIPALISVVATALPHVQSNTLRALVMSASERSPLLPGVPTAKEAGYPGMQAVEWFGIFVPAKTPARIVSALQSAVQRALETESFKSGLAKQSFDVAGLPSDDLVSLIKADTERWGSIVKASGFKPIE
jgi:tripartite-type tricarboxylate transporter receptor subunit TctC